MKLSLTAIAALFATTLHSSVATGTRAASSTNTEEKPNRDLGLLEDLGFADANPTYAFDEAWASTFGDLVEDKMAVVESKAFAKLALVNSVSNCLVKSLGQDYGGYWAVEPEHLQNVFGYVIDGTVGTFILWFQNLAGNDNLITVVGLNKALMFWSVGSLKELWVAIGPTC